MSRGSRLLEEVRRARESMADWNREKTRGDENRRGLAFGRFFLRVRGVTERKAHPPSAHPALTVDANGTRQSVTGSGGWGTRWCATDELVRDGRPVAVRSSSTVASRVRDVVMKEK